MLYNLFENRDFVSVFAVALLAEGVDRNWKSWTRFTTHYMSPSSRRAWIEITSELKTILVTVVALLAEGVDRNFGLTLTALVFFASPSSRRAWIEIEIGKRGGDHSHGRPPRGGRG